MPVVCPHSYQLSFSWSTFQERHIGNIVTDVGMTYCAEGQMSRITHSQHFGRRAIHVRRPWVMISLSNSFHLSGANIFMSANSIFTASFAETNPSRFESRVTWVSTVIPGTSKQLLRTQFAVFRPTPASVTRASSDCGTTPLNSCSSCWQQRRMFRALFL